MRRRTVLLGLVAAAAGGGGLVACTDEATPSPGPSASPGQSAVPILGSTASSSLAPRDVTRYAPAAGTAPAQAYAVGRRDFTFDRGADRPLPTRVWYPATGEVPSTPSPVDGAAPVAGRFPLVLFSHGLTSAPDDFAALLSRWAQAGFVVAAVKYPRTSYGAQPFDQGDIVNQPLDARLVLDRMLALGADPLAAIIDPARVGAAGHSGGGITTAGLFSAHRDERLKAGVLIAATDFLGTPFAGPPAGMLFVHGSDDNTVTYEAGHTVFEAVPWSRAMLTIEGGGHVITDADFETITGTTTEFLRWSLYGDAGAKGRVPSAATTAGIGKLENQL
ncbi:alpha/beta hydrolase family protein [Jidongwangia harbinensis]|uniref:alpha/beta hydrolase family protein n=1 Tax=Jidongwangia harbinensis TaxID=2878561 RepID=UPI001CDA3656|nr:chlorophyllase [Jidongwangia harbinensis]MCA2211972.1 chlorophyllase [Jidongwangia harbinensis]